MRLLPESHSRVLLRERNPKSRELIPEKAVPFVVRLACFHIASGTLR
jgi:hypothetical protein